VRLRICFENGKRRESYDVSTIHSAAMGEAWLVTRIQYWLRSAVDSACKDVECKSFAIGVHLDSADCDHETGPRS
jgi:hypothetical protein